MTSVALQPPSSGRVLPPLLAPDQFQSTGTTSNLNVGISSTSILLPRLRFPSDPEVRTSHKDEGMTHRPHPSFAGPKQLQSHSFSASERALYPGHRRVEDSPSSPAAFDDSAAKAGLAHLLEAAQQCQPMMTFGHNTMAYPDQDYRYEEGMRTPTDSTPTTKKNRLHSIDYLIGESGEDARGAKRPRPTLCLSVNAPAHDMSYQDSMMSPYTPQSVHGPAFQTPQTTPREESRYPSFTSLMSPNDAHSQIQPKFVWETVLVTGNFPDDLCLSETPSGNKANESSGQPVKQGRWTDDEKEFAEALIQQVRNGEVMLPPNVSLRKFIADSLQCKAMRVSKKFRNLKSCQSPQNLAFPDGRKFNPLSLHSIMNTDATMEGDSTSESDVSSPKKGGKTLKRSDYSQHGAVRSGRWSVEEENYAKAMIEAFKAGYLPLHGNVSLRKFLSETLVCHPMRISKKFVGYVRKYHWYRIAAGKCDPEAKRQALERLCVLEREFWMSLQQSQEWTTMQQTESRR